MMKSIFRSCFLLAGCILTGSWDPGPGIIKGDADVQNPVRLEKYSVSYGFEVMADHNGKIIVSSADSTRQAYRLGVRPGMEILGWNTLPVLRKLESMKIRKYRKLYPGMTDMDIKLFLLTRGRPGEQAQVFFMTPTGNNWGIGLKAGQ